MDRIEHAAGAAGAASEKYYVVPMFPYPSGRLHMGHARNYAIADAYARRARAEGKRTMFPIGWDSFGLPAEMAAAASGVGPREWTEANIAQMRVQLGALDLSFDWDRELATHEPAYYKHTQAIFVELMRAGLVYKKPREVYWDPVDQTVLAKEQVIDGRGWRSGAIVEIRVMDVYWIAISRYAREMASEALSWSPGAKADHLAWLGPEAAIGNPRLEDWNVSRQRRWGTPLPASECPECGSLPLPASCLPSTHEQMGTACACPGCGGRARRSEQTLDTFFDSAWYFLRYPMIGEPAAATRAIGEPTRAWCPVDLYVGGREHATMHLVYARFLSRAMADCGMGAPREPFVRYMAQGMVKARSYATVEPDGREAWAPASDVSIDPKDSTKTPRLPDGRVALDKGVQKMSKSKRNGVDPTAVVARWGVDATRLFMFFAAPFEFDIAWDDSAIAGCRRFVDRARALAERVAQDRTQDCDPAAEARLREGSARLARAAREGFAGHEGLNGLVAACMARSSEISRSFGQAVGAQARREAFLELCRQLWPLAPALASRCAAIVDPNWSHSLPADSAEPASEPEAAQAVARVALQFDGRFVENAMVAPGLDAKAAFEAALAASPAFRSKVEASGARWQDAIWARDRALNARAPAREPNRSRMAR